MHNLNSHLLKAFDNRDGKIMVVELNAGRRHFNLAVLNVEVGLITGLPIDVAPSDAKRRELSWSDDSNLIELPLLHQPEGTIENFPATAIEASHVSWATHTLLEPHMFEKKLAKRIESGI